MKFVLSTLAALCRLGLACWGTALLLLALGFAAQQPWATALWPWPEGHLSYWFVSSVLAASAAPIMWIAVSGELAAMRAGALDLALCGAGAGAFFWLNSGPDGEPLRVYALLAGAAVLANLAIYAVSRQIRFNDTRPLPALLRGSMLLFALLLAGVGGALLLGLPHVFPWPLQPATSVLIGWIFLGAAVYFWHGFLLPVRGNACGQLLGFLAHDLLLLAPLIGYLQTVKPEHRLSLLVYLAVIGYSLLLTLVYLFFHPRTRLGSR